MKSRVLILAVLASLFAVGGLFAQELVGKALLDSVNRPIPSFVKVGEEQNGRTVTLFRGQDIVISLSSNPTTGFDWLLRAFDPSLLEQTDIIFKPGSPSNVGSGGVKSYTFKAVMNGSTGLTFAYHRPWEGTVSPMKTFSIKVCVEDAPQHPTNTKH